MNERRNFRRQFWDISTDLQRDIMLGRSPCRVLHSIHLISNLSIVALMHVALRVVDDRLDDPLVIECREAGRFVEQFMDVLIRPIRFHLKICHRKRLFQKLSQKFSQIVDMWFEFFSRRNGRRWNGIGGMTGSWRGMDGRRRQKSLSALFLLLYRVFYGFNYILTSRNRIFILKSIIIWCKNQSNQFVHKECELSGIVLSNDLTRLNANRFDAHNVQKSFKNNLSSRFCFEKQILS